MAKAKKKDHEEDLARQIPSTPSNPALHEFLSRLFFVSPTDAAPGAIKSGYDACPQRLTLRSVADVGTGREVLGPVVDQEEFRPTVDAIPNLEQIVALSNRFDGAAQNEANVAQRRVACTLQAYSHAKGSEHYARFLLAKTPTGIETTSIAEDTTGKRALDEREMELRDKRFSQMLTAQMVSDYREAMLGLVGMYERRLSASELANQELMKAHAAVISLREDLLDRGADRALKMKKELFREEKIERGFNLLEKFALPAALTHLLGPDKAAMALAMANDASVAAPSGAAVHPLVAQLNQLLASLDEKRQLELCGHWDNQEQRQTVPGIFGPEQVALLAQLVTGEAPASRLHELISSITAPQMQRAQALLTEQERAALLAIAIAASNMPSEPSAANGTTSTVQ